MSAPRVTFLVPDVGAPSVGVAVRFARCLAARHPVDIVGPDLGGGVCSMYRGSFPVTAVPCPRIYRQPDFRRDARRLRAAIRGDVIIAVKAFPDTVPLALAEKRRRGCPVLAYLDEWDGALAAGLSPRWRLGEWLRHAHHPLESIHYPRVERLLPRTDGVLCSTTFLQRRFGGRIVHLGVDGSFFRPQPPGEVAALKAELGLADARLIVFGGVARPHKGVEDILAGLRRAGDPRLRLLVVGPLTDYLRALMEREENRGLIHVAGDPPDRLSDRNAEIHRRMPLYLDLGDLVVLPLQDTLLARSQMPCKVFEAMAMAKPIIASRVADLPLALEDAGLLVPPGDLDALGAAIRRVLDDPAAACAMGLRARERCLARYSQEVTARDWLDAVAAVTHAS